MYNNVNYEAVKSFIKDQLTFAFDLSGGLSIDVESELNQKLILWGIFTDTITNKFAELLEDGSLKVLSVENCKNHVDELIRNIDSSTISVDQDDLLVETVAYLYLMWIKKLSMEEILDNTIEEIETEEAEEEVKKDDGE